MKLEHIPYEPKSVCEGTRQAVRASCEEKDLYLTLELEQGHPLQIVVTPIGCDKQQHQPKPNQSRWKIWKRNCTYFSETPFLFKRNNNSTVVLWIVLSSMF